MTDDLVISRADTDDAEILAVLSVTTFRDAFGPKNKKEDMDKYLADEMNVAKLTKELGDSSNHFILAWRDNAPAGYAKLRPNKEPGMQGDNPLEIERIYVLQEHHGKRTGAALMRYCIDYAVNNGHDVLWLGVWEHNPQAIKFYKRWGFELFGAHPFLLGYDLQTDVLMRKELFV